LFYFKIERSGSGGMKNPNDASTPEVRKWMHENVLDWWSKDNP